MANLLQSLGDIAHGILGDNQSLVSPRPQDQSSNQLPDIQFTHRSLGDVAHTILGDAPNPWQDFTNKAVVISRQRNFPPAVTLGQAAVESGRGTSNFAVNRKNYFGYQAYDSNPDAAKSYASPEDSINDYINLVESYPGVSQAAKSGNPYATIRAIENSGYASDPNYVQKVTGTPEFQQYAGGTR